MKKQIKLVTVPVIEHQFVKVGKEVSAMIAELNIKNQVATIDTISYIKKNRAELNKKKATIDSEVKLALSPVTDVITSVKTSYKENVLNQFKEADSLLKDAICSFEMQVKQAKQVKIEIYYDELCQTKKIDFIKFEKLGIKIDLSKSEKKYKEKCTAFIEKVLEDMKLIKSEEFQAEIMAEYKTTLNASKAITDLRARKAAEKIEKEKILLKRTQERESFVRKLGMSYSDMAKCFVLGVDDSITIKQSDIETLDIEEWRGKATVLDLRVKEVKAKLVKSAEDIVSKSPESNITMTDKDSKPIQEVKKPLEAPKEVVKEEEFDAKFKVSASMTKLKNLAAYMKENFIQYETIN